MKKIIFGLLIGGFFMTNVFAKTAVVYFSCTGNTERLSKTCASALDAELFEIEPEEAYTSADLNWNDKASRSTKECNDKNARPKIKNVVSDSGKSFSASEFDTIIVAYPIWWYDAPKIFYSFVESVDFSGKTIVPLCTSGGSGIGKSGTNLEKICGSGNWKDGRQFNSRATEKEIRDFIEKRISL